MGEGGGEIKEGPVVVSWAEDSDCEEGKAGSND